MGKVKERYMNVVEHAEECCGTALTKQEAEQLFYALYPKEEEIFEDAWKRFLMFMDEMEIYQYERIQHRIC